MVRRYLTQYIPVHTVDGELRDTTRWICDRVGKGELAYAKQYGYHLEMLVEELKNLNDTIKQNTINVVSSLANALAARDTYTEGHTARVSDLAATLARQMGMDEEEAMFFAMLGSGEMETLQIMMLMRMMVVRPMPRWLA